MKQTWWTARLYKVEAKEVKMEDTPYLSATVVESLGEKIIRLIGDDGTMERDEVFQLINQERAYQQAKRGSDKDRALTVAEYLLIMEEEMREARHAWVKGDGDYEALEELVQVAAVAVACLEVHGAGTYSIEKRIKELSPSPSVRDRFRRRMAEFGIEVPPGKVRP